MNPAQLNLRFRNEIRCRQLQAYKQQIRNNFLDGHMKHPLPAIDDHIRVIYLTTASRQLDPQREALRGVVYEFQSKAFYGGRKQLPPVGAAEGEAFCSASQGWRSGKQTISMGVLEDIVETWLRADRDSQLFDIVMGCLWMVPHMAYKAIEQCLQKHSGDPAAMGQVGRFWGLCQMMVESMMSMKESLDLSEDENICMTSLIAQKIVYLHCYGLLDHPAIKQSNTYIFMYIFHPDATLDGRFNLGKIDAAFMLIKEGEGIPVEEGRYVQFISSQVEMLIGLEQKKRGQYELQMVDSTIAILRMGCLLSNVHAAPHSHLEQTITNTLANLLNLGHCICQNLKPIDLKLKEGLLLSLLQTISVNKVYQRESLRTIVGQICFKAALLKEKEVVQCWAIELLQKSEAERMLSKLQIIFSCELQAAKREEEVQQLELCLICIDKGLRVLSGL